MNEVLREPTYAKMGILLVVLAFVAHGCSSGIYFVPPVVEESPSCDIVSIDRPDEITDGSDSVLTRYPNVFIEDFATFENISAGNTTAAVKVDLGRAEMWGEPINNGDFEEGNMDGWGLSVLQGGNPDNCEVRSGSPDSPGNYYLYYYSSHDRNHCKVISDPFIASSNYMHYWFDGYEDDEYCYGFQIYEDNNENNKHFFEDKWCSSWGGANDGPNNGEQGRRTKQIPGSLQGRSCRLAIWLGEDGSGDWGRMHMDNIWLSDAAGNPVVMSASNGGNITFIQSQPIVNTWKAVGAARITFFHSIPAGTEISYKITADGKHWTNVTNGSHVIFEDIGSQLKWNATLKTDHEDIGPYIDKVIIEYDFVNDPEPFRPKSGVWTGSSTPTLEWNFTDPDQGDHQSEYLVEIYTDTMLEDQVYNSSWVNSTDPEHRVTEPLPDGVYYWRARTKDAFHGWGNYSPLKKLKLDVTKPVGSIIIEEDVHSVNEQLVDVFITASDNGSGIADMQLVNDQGQAGPWESFASEKRLVLSNTDGLKMIKVRFRDNAGIVSIDYNDTVYYDLMGPHDVVITSPTHPEIAVYYNNTSPVFEWAPPYEETKIKGYSYLVDSSKFTEPGKVLYDINGDMTCTAFGEFTGFKDGSWYFHVTPCDIYDQWGNTTHFQFNIDTTPPAISDLKPESSKWFNGTGIRVSAVFTDIDGFGLNASTIQYSYRPHGGAFSPWQSDDMEYEIASGGIGDNPSRIKAHVDLTFDEGRGNAVRWRITDLSENGPVRSESLKVNIDLSQVSFSDPVPDEDEIFLEGEVECGITISDGGGSGVDGKTIQYSHSYWGPDMEHFKNWTDVMNPTLRDQIDLRLNIDLPPGRDNYILWRARDAVGNPYATSEPVRVWVNSPPEPVVQTPKEWSVIYQGMSFELNATGTLDNEGDELSYYWEIKNGTTKRVVMQAWGFGATVTLPDSGKYLLCLCVDDGNGYNVTEKVDFEVRPTIDPGGKPGEDIWKDKTDTDGDGLPDWWESREGMDPNDPGDATQENRDRYKKELDESLSGGDENLLLKYWWIFAGIPVLFILIVIILVLVTRKRKKDDVSKPVVHPQQPLPYRRERPYPTGQRDFGRPGYGQVPAYADGQAPPCYVQAGPGWSQPPMGAPGRMPGQGTYGTQRSSSAAPVFPALPRHTGASTVYPPAAAPSEAPGTVELLPPLASDTSFIGESTTRLDADYSLPPLTTELGIQNLNLMALPPAPDITNATVSSNTTAHPPLDSPSSLTEPPVTEVPGSVQPSPSTPVVNPTQIDELMSDIFNNASPGASSPTPAAQATPDITTPTPQSSFVPPTSPEMPAPTPPAPTPVPSSPVLASSFRVYRCHSCGTVNPVTSQDHPAIVSCAACGVKGTVD